MPKINKELPFSLATVVANATTAYTRSDFAADYAIGTQPWISASSDNYEFSRSTTQYQRERVDQGTSAGENSLSNWWLRAATSWHNGAGLAYYDSDPADQHRFESSWNVDVWTQGQAKLLPATTKVYTGAVSNLNSSATGAWFIGADGRVYYYNGTTSTAYTTVVTHGTAQKLTTDGLHAIVGTTKGVFKITATGTITQLYHAVNNSGTWDVEAIGFVKERIIACVLYSGTHYVLELSTSPPSPPANVTLSGTGTHTLYTITNTGIDFTSITEMSASILVAYTLGQTSRVLAFTIDTTATSGAISNLPALTAAITVAKMPTGETINVIREYLNTYLIIGTNKGLRVGIDSGNIGFTYGPHIINDDIKFVTFYDSYVYATRNTDLNPSGGSSKGLWRIDLGAAIGSSYAYASDMTIDSGTPTGVTLLGNTNRLLIGASDGLYEQSATALSPTGFINSGKIRYGTSEKKQPVSVNTTIDGDGTYGIVILTSDGTRIEYAPLSAEGSRETNLSTVISPNEHFEINLTLNRQINAGSADTSPDLQQWQLRSLPAPTRSRTITASFLCYDSERDSTGQIKIDNSFDRLKALEQLESLGSVVLLQNFNTGESRYCVIRALQFIQKAPPIRTEGHGGILTVQFQTIDAE